MKSLILAGALLLSPSVFASAKASGPFNIECIVMTTGSSGNDVNFLAQGEHTLNMDQSISLYANGDIEFKVDVSFFEPKDHPELAKNHYSATIFKGGKVVAMANVDFDQVLPDSITVLGPNVTDIKGPTLTEIQCDRK